MLQDINVFYGGATVLRIKDTHWLSWDSCPNVRYYWLRGDTQFTYTKYTAEVAKEALMFVGQQY
jgi:hypothetical protein